jgi:hypothetical protein
MVLVKQREQQASAGITVLEKLVGAAAPQASIITGASASVIRDVLRAQPDVVSFDFETTLFSDAPEGRQGILNEPVGTAAKRAVAGESLSPSSAAGLEKTIRELGPEKLAASAKVDARRVDALTNSLAQISSSSTPMPIQQEDRATLEQVLPDLLHEYGAIEATLGYGRYALIETQPRGPFRKRSDWTRFSDEMVPPSISYSRGMLWVQNGSAPTTQNGSTRSNQNAAAAEAAAARLNLNYLVFRIDPTQLAEDDEELRAAAAAGAALLETVRKPEAETKAALDAVSASSQNLRTAVMRSRLNDVAARAANGSDTKQAFDTAFATAVKNLRWLMESDLPGKDRESLVADVRGQWDARFDDISGTKSGSGAGGASTGPTTAPSATGEPATRPVE